MLQGGFLGSNVLPRVTLDVKTQFCTECWIGLETFRKYALGKTLFESEVKLGPGFQLNLSQSRYETLSLPNAFLANSILLSLPQVVHFNSWSL